MTTHAQRHNDRQNQMYERIDALKRTREMNMTNLNPATTLKISRYINSIRCATKKDYANRYLIWLRNGKNYSEPAYSCSAMAAQGVRFYLYELLPDHR